MDQLLRSVEGGALIEVSTDAFDTEIPSPATGVLFQILVPAGGAAGAGASLAVLSDVEISGEATEASVIAEHPVSQGHTETPEDETQGDAIAGQRIGCADVESSIGPAAHD